MASSVHTATEGDWLCLNRRITELSLAEGKRAGVVKRKIFRTPPYPPASTFREGGHEKLPPSQSSSRSPLASFPLPFASSSGGQGSTVGGQWAAAGSSAGTNRRARKEAGGRWLSSYTARLSLPPP